MNRIPRHFAQALALAAAVTIPATVLAQADFPNRPIKVVVTVPTGSASDTVARHLGEQISKMLGQPIVVENRPGAQSLIAARTVAKAPNDGYTLLVGSNTTHSANPYLVKDMGYDPVKDFVPVASWTINPLFLVVNADLPVKTAAEFVRYAKERPGKLNYGIGNTGGLVAVQMLKSLTGIDAVGISYPGTTQAATDVAGGRLEFMITDPAVARPFVQSGKMRILGISSKQRLSTYPDVPPLTEAGLPGYDYASWIGVFAPAGSPPEAVRKIGQAYAKALAEPATDKFLTDLGMIALVTSPDQFQGFLRDQLGMWGRLTKEAGLTPQ